MTISWARNLIPEGQTNVGYSSVGWKSESDVLVGYTDTGI